MPNDETNRPAETALKALILPATERSPLHKQSRGLLKTTARNVGTTTQEEKTLFTLPSYDSDLRAYRETLTQNTAITGNLLLALWQRNKNDEGLYIINNLSDIARQLNFTPQDLKIYLIYLGGYQYPVVKMSTNEKGQRIMSCYADKLFFVKFNIRLKDSEKETDFTNDSRVGNRFVNFIRDRDIDSVEVSPSQSIIDEINSRKGTLGNVLVSDDFVAYSLGLSELAYKIFCFSASNKPAYAIGFEKLISDKNLNLERQVKGVYKDGKRVSAGQGKKRVLERIKNALDELKTAGHLTSWAYNEKKDAFKWKYCNKIIKHPLLLPKETPPAIDIDTKQQDKGGV